MVLCFECVKNWPLVACCMRVDRETCTLLTCTLLTCLLLVSTALAVMAKGMRPQIPPHTPPGLATLIQECWAAVPEQRPGFDVITIRLQELLNTLKQQEINAVAAAAANATAAKFNAQSALFAAGIGAG